MATIEAPMAQITCMKANQPKLNPTVTSVSSSTISHSPRVNRKLVRSGRLLPLAACSQTDTPASSTKVGAHRWVIQRVANSHGSPESIASGSAVKAVRWKKSRTWSSTMMTITSPRSMSMPSMRDAPDRVTPPATGAANGTVRTSVACAVISDSPCTTGE